MPTDALRTSTGRPLTSRGRRTRERIVAAAAELMLDVGVTGTTMEDVRDRAEVSSSQIYHYFSTKDDLVRAVIAHHDETIVGTHEEVFAHLDSLDGLRRWCERDRRVPAPRRVLRRMSVGRTGSADRRDRPRRPAAVARALARWERAIRQGYDAMRDRGVLDASVDTTSLAVATVAALQGGLLMAQLQRDPAPLRASLDAVVHRAELLTAR